MDPNATLKEIRQILDSEGSQRTLEDWNRLGDLFDALDTWLANGGFLPNAWRR